jgi:hypothetical protein
VISRRFTDPQNVLNIAYLNIFSLVDL